MAQYNVVLSSTRTSGIDLGLPNPRREIALFSYTRPQLERHKVIPVHHQVRSAGTSAFISIPIFSVFKENCCFGEWSTNGLSFDLTSRRMEQSMVHSNLGRTSFGATEDLNVRSEQGYWFKTIHATNTYRYKCIAESFKESRTQLTDRFIVLKSLRHYRNTTTPILSALRVLLPADATNPRDKVFSVLGLLDPHYVERVPARYSSSIVGLFARTTHELMQIERNFTVFMYRGVHFNRKLFQTRNLPTWALDFTYEDSHYLKQVRGITNEACMFDWKYGHGSQKTELSKRIPTLSDDLKVLTHPGYIFDEVEHVVPTHSRSFGEWTSEHRSDIERLASTNLQQKGHVYHSLRTHATTGEDKSYLARFDDAFDKRLGRFCTARGHWGGSSDYWFLVESFALWSTVVDIDLEEVERMKLMSVLKSYMPYADAVGGSAASVWSTKLGLMGISPWGVNPGDTIALVYGSGLPLVLHQQDDGFVFQGLAYLHGIMRGELFPLFERNVFGRHEFRLY